MTIFFGQISLTYYRIIYKRKTAFHDPWIPSFYQRRRLALWSGYSGFFICISIFFSYCSENHSSKNHKTTSWTFFIIFRLCLIFSPFCSKKKMDRLSRALNWWLAAGKGWWAGPLIDRTDLCLQPNDDGRIMAASGGSSMHVWACTAKMMKPRGWSQCDFLSPVGRI